MPIPGNRWVFFINHLSFCSLLRACILLLSDKNNKSNCQHWLHTHHMEVILLETTSSLVLKSRCHCCSHFTDGNTESTKCKRHIQHIECPEIHSRCLVRMLNEGTIQEQRWKMWISLMTDVWYSQSAFSQRLVWKQYPVFFFRLLKTHQWP